MMNQEFWDSELGFGTILGQFFRQEGEARERASCERLQ